MTPTQKNIIGRIAKLKSEIKELWTDCAILRAENERLRQDRNELRRFVYEDAPRIAAKEANDQTAALRDEIEKLRTLLDAHMRYHSKVGCPGGEACYVCRLELSEEKRSTMHCNSYGDSQVTEAYCENCASEINEKEEELTAEIKRLRQELGLIANARRESFFDAGEFREWAQSRARHALGEKPGELTIKKGER